MGTITIDSIGAAGNVDFKQTTSWTHPIGVSAKAAVVFAQIASGDKTISATATLNGVPITPLGSPFNYGMHFVKCKWVFAWGVLNPPSGMQKFVVTTTADPSMLSIVVNSFAYTNVVSFGAPIVSADSSGASTASTTVPAVDGTLIAQVFSGDTTNNFAGYNHAQRWYVPWGEPNGYEFLVGDAPGVAPDVTFSLTAGNYWGSFAVPLSPNPAPAAFAAPQLARARWCPLLTRIFGRPVKSPRVITALAQLRTR
jgi:hypothetical protein